MIGCKPKRAASISRHCIDHHCARRVGGTTEIDTLKGRGMAQSSESIEPATCPKQQAAVRLLDQRVDMARLSRVWRSVSREACLTWPWVEAAYTAIARYPVLTAPGFQ